MVAFCFFSHKVLRWLGPFFILLAFFCSVALANHRQFAALTTAECIFFALALLGYCRKKLGHASGLCSIPLHFCTMNLALLMGFRAYLTGRQSVVWTATPRQASLTCVATTDAGDCEQGLANDPGVALRRSA